ncbi:MAG: hypothetical protein ACFFCV_07005 [Promethearchaeota archaeon]
MENSLTTEEWNRVYNSVEWANAKIQIAREIIAGEIYYRIYNNGE